MPFEEALIVAGAFFIITIVVVLLLIRYSNRRLKERLDVVEDQSDMLSKMILRQKKELHEKLKSFKQESAALEEEHPLKVSVRKR
ncbi:MAG: hypothetical protein V1847_03130 [Candidatus Diapherotrites archaeon]